MTESTAPLDLSPLTIARVERGGRELLIEPPLTLEPVADEEVPASLTVEQTELGLSASAESREALAEAIAQALFFLWDEYACEAPERLAPAAQRVRQALPRRL